MAKFNYILNDLALINLVTRNLYSKNVCREDKEELENQIKLIMQENKQLKDNWIKLKEYINKMHEYFLYTDVNEIHKQSMKLYNQFPNLFNLSELNASDRILSSICKKMQKLEQGSDNK